LTVLFQLSTGFLSQNIQALHIWILMVIYIRPIHHYIVSLTSCKGAYGGFSFINSVSQCG